MIFACSFVHIVQQFHTFFTKWCVFPHPPCQDVPTTYWTSTHPVTYFQAEKDNKKFHSHCGRTIEGSRKTYSFTFLSLLMMNFLSSAILFFSRMSKHLFIIHALHLNSQYRSRGLPPYRQNNESAWKNSKFIFTWFIL